MKKAYQVFITIVSTVLACTGIVGNLVINEAYAAARSKTIKVTGTKYVFEEKSKYELTSPEKASEISKGGT